MSSLLNSVIDSSALLTALVGGAENDLTKIILICCCKKNNIVGTLIYYSIVEKISLNFDQLSKNGLSLFHYIVLFSIDNPDYTLLLDYCLKNLSVNVNAVDCNGKNIGQYLVLLGDQDVLLDKLISFGLNLSLPDKNGVYVNLLQQGSGSTNTFLPSEFITKYNTPIQQGGISNKISGMRQMSTRSELYNTTNNDDYDDDYSITSELEGGGNDNDNAHDLIIKNIAILMNYKDELRARAVKSLLYQKVKNEYPNLKSKERTKKLEEFASDKSLIESLNESDIKARMTLLIDVAKKKKDEFKKTKESSDQDSTKTKTKD